MKYLLSCLCQHKKQLLKKVREKAISLKKYGYFIVGIWAIIIILIAMYAYPIYLNINIKAISIITCLLIIIINTFFYLKKKKKVVYTSILLVILLEVLAGVSFAGLCNLKNEEEVVGFVQLIIYLVFFIVYALFIAYRIKEIVDIWKNWIPVGKYIILFLQAIVRIILLFANIYLILTYFDSTTLNFGNGKPNDSTTLYFEVVYFSAMTFLTAGCDVSPATIPAKIFVLIESLIFSVGICIIIFGFIDRGRNQET